MEMEISLAFNFFNAIFNYNLKINMLQHGLTSN